MNSRKMVRWLASAMTALLVLLALPALPAAAQTVTLSQSTGAVGTTVAVSGTNFTPSVAYQIRFAYFTSFESVTTGTTSATGTITGSFIVAQAPTATYTVRVETSPTELAVANFAVVSSISLSATAVQVGDQLTVSGYGFRAAASVAVRFDGTTQVLAVTNASGTFVDGIFPIPATYSGSHTVSATDGTNTVSITITIAPKVTLSPVSGAPGATVTAVGTGFLTSRTMRLTYDGTTLTTSPATVTSNTVGSFSATFTVPATFSRNQVITATDGVGSASAAFTLLASVSLSPTSGTAGAQVTVTGSAFTANKAVTVLWDNTAIATSPPSVVTGGTGAFTAVVTVPAGAGGLHTVRVTDDTNTASANFTVAASLKVTPASGVVGIEVTASGTGFGATRQVSISMEGTQVAQVATDSSGGFTATFNAPAVPGGQRPVNAGDGVFSASAQFNVIASIRVTPASGPINTRVRVDGSGFGASRQVTIRFGNTQVKVGATSAAGIFSETFDVPQLDAGSYTVSVGDGASTATASFNITASIGLDTATGDVGSSITIAGSGFSGAVTIRYDDEVVATAAAGADGKFSASFDAPPSLHGVHTVTASDATKSLSTIFMMESTPPQAPKLVLPDIGASVGGRVSFQWEAVTDPSGVSYTLEVAPDASFGTITLRKAGLVATDYTLAKEEVLPQLKGGEAYYWRVRAIDGASNEGDWATPRAFKVRIFPAWALWTLIGLGGLLFTLLVFWFGIRVGRRSSIARP